MNRINELHQQVANNNEETKRLEERKSGLEQEISDIEASKQEEIGKLKKNIEEMSLEFSGMLKETLEKMKNKIEVANEKWDNENNDTMLEKFKEVKSSNN